MLDIIEIEANAIAYYLANRKPEDIATDLRYVRTASELQQLSTALTRSN